MAEVNSNQVVTSSNEVEKIEKVKKTKEKDDVKNNKNGKKAEEKHSEKSSKLNTKWWKILWNRSYIPVFILIFICFLFNTAYINRDKYDGKRIYQENFFNLTFFKNNKQNAPCGLITAEFGFHRNRSCSGNYRFHRRYKFGCNLTECGDPSEISCSSNDTGWISKEILTTGCSSSTIQHFCCRSETRLCTWQGTWSSLKLFQDVDCSFEPDNGCGKLICNNGVHSIFQDSMGSCRVVVINGKRGIASCGLIDFNDNSDTWYKKIDEYSIFDP
ncbi:hypothetical protein B9Z55_002158 [Caenorhabditis nigoni]|nr:hypothetical protein B9Z55_002158 [Caenorhabditis nigoni]